MAKELVHGLPKTRLYGIVEAAFSVQVDMDNGGMKNPSFYASLWGWSRTKVKNFLRAGQVNHTDSTKSQQNQVKVRFIKGIGDGKITTKSEQDQTKDKAKSTTINPNPNPNSKNINTRPPKEADPRIKSFLDFYSEQFQKQFGAKPPIEGGRDGKIIKTLLRDHDLKRLQAELVAYLKTMDSFFQKCGYDLPRFKIFLNGRATGGYGVTSLTVMTKRRYSPPSDFSNVPEGEIQL